jgi:Tol biopolymer transport system component
MLGWICFCVPVLLGAPSVPPVSTNHGAMPVVSPDGRWIAFLSDRTGSDQVFIIAADGTQERQITHLTRGASNVQWASDGKRLRLGIFLEPATHLFEIDLDGASQREVVAVPGRGPQIAPDGHHIVFGGGLSWTTTQFTVADIADGNLRNSRLVNDGKSIAWNAKWSPTGKTIAFTGRDSGVLQVCLVDEDGSNRRQLTHNSSGNGNAQVPSWSRDGEWIAYQVNREGHGARIWVIRRDGSDARPVGSDGEHYLDETPTWFPDGGRLAFQSDRSGRMEIWTINLDGSGLRQVTR